MSNLKFGYKLQCTITEPYGYYPDGVTRVATWTIEFGTLTTYQENYTAVMSFERNAVLEFKSYGKKVYDSGYGLGLSPVVLPNVYVDGKKDLREEDYYTVFTPAQMHTFGFEPGYGNMRSMGPALITLGKAASFYDDANVFYAKKHAKFFGDNSVYAHTADKVVLWTYALHSLGARAVVCAKDNYEHRPVVDHSQFTPDNLYAWMHESTMLMNEATKRNQLENAQVAA